MSKLKGHKPFILIISAFLLVAAIFPTMLGYTTQTPTYVVLESEDGFIDEECTGYIVTGDAGRGQNYFHKNRDSSAWREGVALVTPADGYKYIAVHTDSHGRSQGYGGAALGGVNEMGVGGATFAGFTNEPRPSNPWAPSTACRYALQYGGTSEEYVLKFGEIVDQHGITSGGISAAVCPDTAWKIEYAAHQWAVEGPFRDTYEPIGNAFTITSMRQYCTADWSRYGRIRKAREILDAGLYPNAPGETWFRSWDMQKAFAFARNTDPLESPISGTLMFGTEQLPGSVVGGSDPRPVCDGLPWGRAGRTVSSHLVMPDKQHPNFLSVLWWSMDRPTIAPFIPLYIGVTRLPEAIDANADFEAADTFNELRYLVYEHPEYQEMVLEIWEKFELRQNRYIRDYLAARVRQLVNTWKEDEASELLNEFLQSQVDEAMDTAKKLIEKIKSETAAQLYPFGIPQEPVIVPVTGVTLNLEELTLTVGGGTAALAATVVPSNADNKNVTWSSSDESVATVSANSGATVHPVGEGTVVITVTTEDGEFAADCAVTVLPPPGAGDAFSGGYGTVDDPYQIATPEHLDNVRYYMDAHFIMTDNVDLDGYGDAVSGWVPIGGGIDEPFSGTFDGDEYTISNLFIDRSETNYIGLFGYANADAVIRDVNLEAGSLSGNEWVGLLVGRNDGEISSVSVAGDVAGASRYTGGLVGRNFGTITGSSSACNVANGDLGLAGGFVGWNDGGTITSSFSEGSIVGGGNAVGGFAGRNSNGGVISESYSASTAMSGNHYLGGFVGYNFTDGTITDSFFTGEVTGPGNRLGGITGWNRGVISNTYSTGSVNGAGNDVGGLVGLNDGTVTDSYWDTQSSGNLTSGGGTGKTTVEMKQSATFVDWDFTTIWGIIEDTTYPYLRWMM